MLEFETTGIEEVNRKLRQCEAKFGDASPVMKSISVILDRWHLKNFQNDGALAMDGRPWQLLKGRLYKGKWYDRVKYPVGGGKPRLTKNAKVLRDTGKGRASIRTGFSRSHAQIGTTDLTYMAYHHVGSGHLPVRRVIPEYRQVKVQVLDTINHWLLFVWPGRR